MEKPASITDTGFYRALISLYFCKVSLFRSKVPGSSFQDSCSIILHQFRLIDRADAGQLFNKQFPVPASELDPLPDAVK